MTVALLLFGPVILGAVLGVAWVKKVEKRRKAKLGMGELKFYIGIPIIALMLISIWILNNMK